MAVEVRSFAVTLPAGTAQAAPATTALTMPPRTVESVELVIPDGCAGLVGFRLTMAGTPVIPTNLGAWLVSNGEVIRWPLEGYPDSGAWQLQGYNTDLFDHTIYARFLLGLVTATNPAASPTFVPVADLTPTVITG